MEYGVAIANGANRNLKKGSEFGVGWMYEGRTNQDTSIARIHLLMGYDRSFRLLVARAKIQEVGSRFDWLRSLLNFYATR